MKDTPSQKVAQLVELMFLRDVVIPHMERPDTLVNLDTYMSRAACGTYMCLAGWYVCLRHEMTMGEWEREHDGNWCGSALLDKTFGSDTFRPLFGTRGYSGSLADRKEALDDLIDERMTDFGIEESVHLCDRVARDIDATAV